MVVLPSALILGLHDREEEESRQGFEDGGGCHLVFSLYVKNWCVQHAAVGWEGEQALP